MKVGVKWKAIWQITLPQPFPSWEGSHASINTRTICRREPVVSFRTPSAPSTIFLLTGEKEAYKLNYMCFITFLVISSGR